MCRGPNAVKYGVTRDYVLGLKAVLPTGEIIKTGVKTKKGVAGYDLTRLITGSEGTLAIIVEIIVKLLPKKETSKTSLAIFSSIEETAQTITKIISSSIIPKSLEYMDRASIKCIQDYSKFSFPINAEALLIIEVDGKKTEVDEKLKDIEKICIENNAKFEIAKNKEEEENIWKTRKAISPALFKYGKDKINEDIVVPINKIPQMVKKINQLREKSGFMIVSFGHAGDGNIHFNLMLDKKNKEDLKKAEEVIEELFDYTIFLEGTISGEHGIGTSKKAYITKEIDADSLEIMKKIKKTFDPNGILNPEKIFP